MNGQQQQQQQHANGRSNGGGTSGAGGKGIGDLSGGEVSRWGTRQTRARLAASLVRTHGMWTPKLPNTDAMVLGVCMARCVRSFTCGSRLGFVAFGRRGREKGMYDEVVETGG